MWRSSCGFVCTQKSILQSAGTLYSGKKSKSGEGGNLKWKLWIGGGGGGEGRIWYLRGVKSTTCCTQSTWRNNCSQTKYMFCCRPSHRVHRVVTSAFWRTFSHEGKISLGWWGWGVQAHPLLLHLPSPVKLQCTLQLSGQINWPCLISCKDMYSVGPLYFTYSPSLLRTSLITTVQLLQLLNIR